MSPISKKVCYYILLIFCESPAFPYLSVILDVQTFIYLFVCSLELQLPYRLSGPLQETAMLLLLEQK